MSNTWHFSKGKPVRALLLPRVTPPSPAKAALLSPLEMSRVRTRAALRGEGALRPPAAITSPSSVEFQGKGEEDAETYARDLPLPTSSMSAPVALSWGQPQPWYPVAHHGERMACSKQNYFTTIRQTPTEAAHPYKTEYGLGLSPGSSCCQEELLGFISYHIYLRFVKCPGMTTGVPKCTAHPCEAHPS